MSDWVLPDFVGFAFDRKRNPSFDTRIQQTARGTKELRAKFDPFPMWHFTVPINLLLNDLDTQELDELIGFYLAVGGRTDTWLYDCPRYNQATAVSLGTGDGVNKVFQLRLVHPYGFIEPVHHPKVGVQVFVDGVLQESGYEMGASGLVSFTTTTPAFGAAVTWSGGYYHRCRFDADLPEFSESSVGVFEYPDFSFIGSPVTLL